MLPIIKIENAWGNMLDFSKDARYAVTASGTAPPGATVNTSKVALNDGARFNSSTRNVRNLILNIDIIRDVGRARMDLYRYIVSGAYIKIYYKTDVLDVWISGYVEAIECDPYTLGQFMQVSIICPFPFWQDLKETYTDAGNITNMLEFPWSAPETGVELSSVDANAYTVVMNSGHVESGMRLVLRATVRSLQPRIYNLKTGEWIGFLVDMFPGDILTVDTTQGQKSVYLESGGVITNYINTVMTGSTWLQLAPGENEISYTVDEGDVHLGIFHMNKYQGV